jgi:peptidoglycan/xylan/chitin deacetylase (PgdA/CDA1 family)
MKRMSKKALLAQILFNYLSFISLPVFSAIRPNFLHILAYHRVLPLPGEDYPFSEGTISASPREFDEQMSFVKKYFNVINFRLLCEAISKGKALPKNPLIITFDDGYEDNYKIAWPVLKKYGLTATIFLATSFMESSNIFWFDRLSYIIKHYSGDFISVGKYVFQLESNNRKTIRESIMKIFRSIPEKERVRLFDQMEKKCNVKVASAHISLAKPLSWRQICEMSEEGIEFGSHTVSHPFLTNLTDSEMRNELLESKNTIERKLGKSVKCIAYPSGVYDQRVINSVKICGYQFGVSYENDSRRFDVNELFNMPRIHVEPDVDPPLFQANLIFPQLFVKLSRRLHVPFPKPLP